APLDWLGYAASACVLLTFCMQSMLRLRLVALFSNVAFITYGWVGRLMPILVLHCVLLVINSAALVRLAAGWAIAWTGRSHLHIRDLVEESHATPQHRA